MLRSLYVQNYAIIDEVEMLFGPGFNVITGETGAGKSILLGALNLIRGGRADTKVLYDQDKKCIVEAIFIIKPEVLKKIELIDGLDINVTEVKIRREISSTGRSRAFVNDQNVRLQDLKQLSDTLLDIHNQFDTMSISTPEYQLQVIDAIAENKDLFQKYSLAYEKYVSLKGEIRRLESSQSQSKQDQEFITFQLEELEKIKLDGLKKDDIEGEFNTLSNAEDIKQILTKLNYTLSESDQNVADSLRELLKDLSQYSDGAPRLLEITQSLEDMIESMREIEQLSNGIDDSLEVSEDRITELKEIIDHLSFLENKYHVIEVRELILIRDDYRKRSMGDYDVAQILSEKRQELDNHVKKLKKTSKSLTDSRLRVVDKITATLEKSLHDLAMPNAQLLIERVELSDYEITGKDLITFSFSSNKGIAPQPINEVASGGELSRLALSVRSMIAELFGVPTLIFDEIDSGISGVVALKVGHILEDIAFSRQVICITHSPQVASIAQQHFFVAKHDTDIRTITQVHLLDEEKRTEEIAKMLSTDPPSPSALQNARELLGL
ncbi:MAG: DNA repair protein RecN (Recombination protein N) [Saprospiraceae bacterium]|jgi:DNA repair protein RecN (Recombination protein N)